MQHLPEHRQAVLLAIGGGLDLTALCVTSGKICWLLYVDALVLNMDGNVLDALSIATRVGVHPAWPIFDGSTAVSCCHKLCRVGKWPC